jgi:hypothetical protein
MNTTVVINRRELEYSVSGLMHPQYPKPDIMHLVERLHTPGALRLEDLEMSGPIELIPGVVLEAAGAHTEGSMNVHVETAEGRATICGDVIYDFQDQIIEPMRSFGPEEFQVTGNHAGSKRGEKAADPQAAERVEIPAAVHDKPAKIAHGQVVGRLDMACPGRSARPSGAATGSRCEVPWPMTRSTPPFAP